MIECVIKMVVVALVILIQWGYGSYMYNRGVDYGRHNTVIETLKDKGVLTEIEHKN